MVWDSLIIERLTKIASHEFDENAPPRLHEKNREKGKFQICKEKNQTFFTINLTLVG